MQTVPHFSVFTLHTAVSPGKLTLAGRVRTLVNVKNPCGQDLLGVGTRPTSLRPGLGACQEFFLPKNAVCKQLLLLLYWDWSTSCKRYLHENPQDFFKKLNTTIIPILQIRKHQWDKFWEVQESCPRVTYSVTGGARRGRRQSSSSKATAREPGLASG